MKYTSASAEWSAEHLNQLKQTLQEINNLLPLLPVPDTDAPLPLPAATDSGQALLPHSLYMAEMIKEFRKDVNLYLSLSERTRLHSQSEES